MDKYWDFYRKNDFINTRITSIGVGDWGEGNDISKVAADNVNAVWVDEAASANYDKVIVNGCSKKQE